jgi:hypothetical protein
LGVTCRVYLYRSGSTGVFPDLTANEIIGTLAVDGTFTLNQPGTGDNWTLIERGGLETATAILPSAATSPLYSEENDIKFSQWDITSESQIDDTDKFAIVVTFAYIDETATVLVNSISVTPGDIPTRPIPKTVGQTLQECQYYYEKSYPVGVVPGTVAESGAVLLMNNNFVGVGGADNDKAWFKMGLQFDLAALKRPVTSPALNANTILYSTQAASPNFVRNVIYNGLGAGSFHYQENTPTSNYTFSDYNRQRLTYLPNDATVITTIIGQNFQLGATQFHYVLDLRIGIAE